MSELHQLSGCDHQGSHLLLWNRQYYLYNGWYRILFWGNINSMKLDFLAIPTASFSGDDFLISISKVLPNKHNDMTASWRVSKEVNVVADGFWGVTIVAYAICLAWCLNVESGSIDG